MRSETSRPRHIVNYVARRSRERANVFSRRQLPNFKRHRITLSSGRISRYRAILFFSLIVTVVARSVLDVYPRIGNVSTIAPFFLCVVEIYSRDRRAPSGLRDDAARDALRSSCRKKNLLAYNSSLRIK